MNYVVDVYSQNISKYPVIKSRNQKKIELCNPSWAVGMVSYAFQRLYLMNSQ